MSQEADESVGKEETHDGPGEGRPRFGCMVDMSANARERGVNGFCTVLNFGANSKANILTAVSDLIVFFYLGLPFIRIQLLAVSGTGGTVWCSTFSKAGLGPWISSALSGKGDGLGERSFTGDNDPRGRGMFAGMVRSPSSSRALSYCGLVPRDLEGVTDGLRPWLLCA